MPWEGDASDENFLGDDLTKEFDRVIRDVIAAGEYGFFLTI